MLPCLPQRLFFTGDLDDDRRLPFLPELAPSLTRNGRNAGTINAKGFQNMFLSLYLTYAYSYIKMHANDRAAGKHPLTSRNQDLRKQQIARGRLVNHHRHHSNPLSGRPSCPGCQTISIFTSFASCICCCAKKTSPAWRSNSISHNRRYRPPC